MNIKTLPDELEDIVYSYIPKSAMIFVTKQNYLTSHHLVRSLVNRKNIENYIRSMVRQDNDFVFKLLLVENYNRWLNMTKYYYKECIFNNYLMFLESYAIDNQSTKPTQQQHTHSTQLAHVTPSFVNHYCFLMFISFSIIFFSVIILLLILFVYH